MYGRASRVHGYQGMEHVKSIRFGTQYKLFYFKFDVAHRQTTYQYIYST